MSFFYKLSLKQAFSKEDFRQVLKFKKSDVEKTKIDLKKKLKQDLSCSILKISTWNLE